MSKEKTTVESLWRLHLKECHDFGYTSNEQGQVVLYKWGNPHWEPLQVEGVGGLQSYIEKWIDSTCRSMYSAQAISSCVRITPTVIINLKSPLRTPETVAIALDEHVLKLVYDLEGKPSIYADQIDKRTGRIIEAGSNGAILKQGKSSTVRDFLYPVRIRRVSIPKECISSTGQYTPPPTPQDSIFAKFLRTSIRKEDTDAFQEFFGDLLCDKVRKAAPVLHGAPDSGKSRWLGLANAILGPKNCVSADLGKMGSRFSMEAWVGKQVVIVDELPKSIGDESILKKSIGGALVNVERKYVGDLSVVPRWKFLIGANHLPSFSEKTSAIATRLRVFSVLTVPVDERIEEVDHLIARQESNIVLDWMLEGLLRIEARGRALRPDELSGSSKAVQDASAKDSNPVISWIEEAEVVVDAGCYTPKDELHGLFREWADQHGHKGFAQVSSVVFFRDMFLQALAWHGVDTSGIDLVGKKVAMAGLRRLCLPIRVRNAKDVMQAQNNEATRPAVVPLIQMKAVSGDPFN